MKKLIFALLMMTILLPVGTAQAMPPPASNIFLMLSRRIIDTMPAGIVPHEITLIKTSGGSDETNVCAVTGSRATIGVNCAENSGWGNLNISYHTVLSMKPLGATYFDADQYVITWSNIAFGTVGRMRIKTDPITSEWLDLFKWGSVTNDAPQACNEDESVCRYWNDRNYLKLRNTVKIIWTRGVSETNEDITKVPSQNPGTLYGDIYAGGDANMGTFVMDDNSVLASGLNISNLSGVICNTTASGVKMCNYSAGNKIKWGTVEEVLKKTKRTLIKERAKYYCSSYFGDEKYIRNSGVKCKEAKIAGSWQLQNGFRTDIDAPYVSKNPDIEDNNWISPHEGEVWYIKGDLILDDLTYTGRATVIVDGNLIINGDLKKAAGITDSMLGFIVAGDGPQYRASDGRRYAGAIIENTSDYVDAFIYSENNISIINRTAGAPLTFNGVLAAFNKITLPNRNGAGSSFSYDKKINDNPLPGFRELMSKIIIKDETTP